MKTLTVTPELLNELSPYQGQTKKLTVGETLFVIAEKVPCVFYKTGRAKTFTILSDLQHYSGNGSPVNADMGYYNANRWSLNDKFTKKALTRV